MIDDLHLNKPDSFGIKGSLELIRQYFDHKTWFDHRTFSFKKVEDIQFMATATTNETSV